MKAEDLKNSILQMAMEGKLVPQDPNDEPASVLLENILEEKEKLIKEKKIKRNNKESFIFRKNGHFYEKVGKKGEPVCIDDEIPFDVQDNWELCRLENLCSLLNPKIEEKSEYPYLNAKYLRNKIDPEIKEKGRFVEKNTKVILVDGENSGEVFLTHADGYMGSTFRVLYINSQMCEEYILKLLELWKNPLKKSKKGAAIPHLNKDIFNKILVGIPPINEQKRIINEINQSYPLIEEYALNKEKLDKLNNEFPEQLKNSILQEAIQGKLIPQDPNDESVYVLLEKIREEKERLVKEKKIKRNNKESFIYKKNNHYFEMIGKKGEPVCIDDEIPFEIPETWEWCRLNTICTKLTDGSHNPPPKKDSGIPVLSVKNINQNEIDFNSIYRFTDEEGYNKENPRTNISKGDIILGIVGSIGEVAIYNSNEKVIAQRSIAIIKTEIFNNYLTYIFESNLFKKYAKTHSKGTAQRGLYLNSLKEFLVPTPPLNEQKRIVTFLENILNQL